MEKSSGLVARSPVWPCYLLDWWSCHLWFPHGQISVQQLETTHLLLMKRLLNWLAWMLDIFGCWQIVFQVPLSSCRCGRESNSLNSLISTVLSFLGKLILAMFYNNLISIPILIVASFAFEDWGAANLAQNLYSLYKTLLTYQPSGSSKSASLRHSSIRILFCLHKLLHSMVSTRNLLDNIQVSPLLS